MIVMGGFMAAATAATVLNQRIRAEEAARKRREQAEADKKAAENKK